MTVCLAALCRDGDESRAVVATDRMVSLAGFIEFEHAIPKMVTASTRALAMSAGDALIGSRIAEEVARSLAGTPTVLEIAQQLARHYEATRTARIEHQLLALRGLNFQAFYGGHNSFNPQLAMMLDQQMQQFNLGVELLLAGVDDTGAHIYSIQNPGQPENLHDIIGYAAIGSGAIHGIQSMIGFGHTGQAQYHETVFRVYASKRRSEVAPGVGLDTDMAIIGAGGIHRLSDDELDQLRQIYENFETSTTAALTEQLAAFKLGEATAEKEASGDG
ncbi:MAG TPA: hypothetical protein VFA44_00015 [Gaiellaceae bacterium]|nr:hypothetical protein [Gaiellaceae bacterium]